MNVESNDNVKNHLQTLMPSLELLTLGVKQGIHLVDCTLRELSTHIIVNIDVIVDAKIPWL